MWKEIPPFSFSAGERKIMAHFVVGYPVGRIATDVDTSTARLETSIAVFRLKGETNLRGDKRLPSGLKSNRSGRGELSMDVLNVTGYHRRPPHLVAEYKGFFALLAPARRHAGGSWRDKLC